MNLQNKKHERTIDFFWDNGVWKFPCCNVEIIFPPRDEYPEEELTTILCQYGCGHIILEEY